MEKSKKVVLALGEGSHSHILESKKAVEYSNQGFELDFLLEDLGVVRHVESANHAKKAEHDVIVLPPGKHVRVIQSEYDPFTEGWAQVFD